ncbi:DUF4956 domain-containing protein [Candidatus Bipolaricaulota bacterium]|nr:DUF4956 domain-containing protein [Candidatus Bipolaricaulota bacterium]
MFDQLDPAVISLVDVVIAITVTLFLGLFIGFIYRKVTPGSSYSVSILYALLYLSMIVSLVMMIISNQIARAFTLVGALSVIRFRTPIKDAKDTAFIFLALAAGMGTGVGLYMETILGTGLIGIFILLIHRSRVGLQMSKETLVKFTIPLTNGKDTSYHQEVFESFLRDYKLVNTRSLQDSDRLELTFLVKPLGTTENIKFSQALSSVPDIQRVSVMALDEEDFTSNVL